jgi:hypothetical protein
MGKSVPPIPIPHPSFLDGMEYFGVRGGQKVCRSPDYQRYDTWDALHGEIEVLTKRGKHLGALHAVTGALIKPAVKGRSIAL